MICRFCRMRYRKGAGALMVAYHLRLHHIDDWIVEEWAKLERDAAIDAEKLRRRQPRRRARASEGHAGHAKSTTGTAVKALA